MNLRLYALASAASGLLACGPLETARDDHTVNSSALGPAQLEGHFDDMGLGPTQRSAEPFDRLAFRWDTAPGAEAQIEVRIRPEANSWGSWSRVQVTWREGSAHNGHIDLRNSISPFDYQLRVSGSQPRAMTSLVVEPVILADSTGPAETEDSEPSFVQTLRLGLAPADLVNPREAWGARRAACESADTPRRIYVHHTVTPFNDALAPAARMRQIQAFHMDNRGWCDIGYHYVVSPDGQLWQGRPENRLGAHVANHNSGSTGISFMGNYMEDRPTEAQLRQVGSLVRWLRSRYEIAEQIRGHRDSGQSSCPGDHLYARLNDIETYADGGGEPGPAPEEAPAEAPAPVPAPEEGARGTYRGVVFAAPDTGARIPGARVWIEEQNLEIRSSETGYFAFSLPGGEYTVWAEAPGFAPASSRRRVTQSREVWGSIGLDEAPEAPPEPPAEPAPEAEPAEDRSPPTIRIDSPRDGLVVHTPQIRVEGGVEDDRDSIHEVELAGQQLPVQAGRFSAEVTLSPGPNWLRVFAIDGSGNLGSAAITVHFEAPEPERPCDDDRLDDREDELDGPQFSGGAPAGEGPATAQESAPGLIPSSSVGSPAPRDAQAEVPVPRRGSVGCALAPFTAGGQTPLGGLSLLLALWGLWMTRRAAL